MAKSEQENEADLHPHRPEVGRVQIKPVGLMGMTKARRVAVPGGGGRLLCFGCPPGSRQVPGGVTKVAGVVGVCGSVACVTAMVLPLVGLVGTGGAAGMASMAKGSGPGSRQVGGVLGFLVRVGPELLVASALLVVVSLFLRRRIAALPAAGAGALLYWGMYAQTSDAVMYVSLVGAYLIWAATYLWARSRFRSGSGMAGSGRCAATEAGVTG